MNTAPLNFNLTILTQTTKTMIFDIILAILILISIIAATKTIVSVVKEEYNNGYTDCMRQYLLIGKVAFRYDWPSPYAKGWNDACQEIAKKVL